MIITGLGAEHQQGDACQEPEALGDRVRLHRVLGWVQQHVYQGAADKRLHHRAGGLGHAAHQASTEEPAQHRAKSDHREDRQRGLGSVARPHQPPGHQPHRQAMQYDRQAQGFGGVVMPASPGEHDAIEQRVDHQAEQRDQQEAAVHRPAGVTQGALEQPGPGEADHRDQRGEPHAEARRSVGQHMEAEEPADRRQDKAIEQCDGRAVAGEEAVQERAGSERHQARGDQREITAVVRHPPCRRYGRCTAGSTQAAPQYGSSTPPSSTYTVFRRVYCSRVTRLFS